MENGLCYSKVHPHALCKIDRDNGWACDGRNFPEGCRQGCTGFNQSTGWARYHCIHQSCDFDLCEGCLRFNLVYYSKVHPHALGKIDRDNGWACNGKNFPGGCRQGCTGFNQSAGWARYQCIVKNCDFDFCEGCLILNKLN